MAAPTLFTVGHSTHPVEELAAWLHAAEVAQVVDVRRFPGSRRNPQHGLPQLPEALAAAGLGYVGLPALGGRRRPVEGSPNRAWRVAAFNGYADHLRSDEGRDGLAALLETAAATPSAIMCAEAPWWRCHRRIVADAVLLQGWDVRHVMGPGKLVAHVLPEWARRGDDGLPVYPAT